MRNNSLIVDHEDRVGAAGAPRQPDTPSMSAAPAAGHPTFTFARARPEAAGRVVRVTRAIIIVEGMLSRWLGRRMPLDPARLFALTAEPGRELPHAITVIH